MSQEVKVGQVWVGKCTGIEYKVVGVGSVYAKIEYCSNNGNARDLVGIWELLNSGPYQLKNDTSGSIDGGNSGLLDLRDHFAGLAMQAMMAAPIGKFNHKNTNEIAISAYQAADKMLKSRGE